MTTVRPRAQLRELAMKYTRVLFLLALCVCAGALGIQAMTRAAIAAQAPSPAGPPSPAQPSPPGIAITNPPIVAPALPEILVNEPVRTRIRNYGAPFVVPGQYVVMLSRDATQEMIDNVGARIKALGGKILFTYRTGIPGFAFRTDGAPAQNIIKAIDDLFDQPGVISVSADQRFKEQAVQVQSNPPDGLDRISQRLLGADPNTLNKKFTYTQTGTGVDVYVIDSGISLDQTEFQTRASQDYSAVCDVNLSCSAADFKDCDGHGTAVAGVIGASNFGVARNARVHSVRAYYWDTEYPGGVPTLVCMATQWSVMAAIEWVTQHHGPYAVANMSLMADGPPIPELDQKILDSIDGGVTYVFGAGNDGTDACTHTPSHLGGVDGAGAKKPAITVGSSHPKYDSESPGSSFGNCLDLFAPGEDIVTLQPDGITDPNCRQVLPISQPQTQRCSGTSISASHVAGCAALLLESLLTPNSAERPPGALLASPLDAGSRAPGALPDPAPDDASRAPGVSPSTMTLPERVWAGLLAVANVNGTTVGWRGIVDAMTNWPITRSPNRLLHCGALNNLMDDAPEDAP